MLYGSSARNWCGIGYVKCCFFFFQAEDGIRDSSVTGVQTCALPICDRDAIHRARVVGLLALEQEPRAGSRLHVVPCARAVTRRDPTRTGSTPRPGDRKSVV